MDVLHSDSTPSRSMASSLLNRLYVMYPKGFRPLFHTSTALKLGICLSFFGPDEAAKENPSFNGWLSSIFSTWHFEAQDRHYRLCIELGQGKCMNVLKHKGVPGSTQHLEALRDRINARLDACYSAAAVHIRDQKVVLKLNWAVPLQLLESSVKKVGITLRAVARLIFEDTFPADVEETGSKEDRLYGVKPLSIDFEKVELGGDDTDEDKQNEECNVQVFEEIKYDVGKPLDLCCQSQIEELVYPSLTVVITASSAVKEERKFERLILKRGESSRLQEEADGLLKKRNCIRHAHIGKFFLRRMYGQEFIGVHPEIYCERYEKPLAEFVAQNKQNHSFAHFAHILRMHEQVLLAIQHLGSIGIIHSDIKGMNVMLALAHRASDHGNLKLIDFGSAVYDPDSRLKALTPENEAEALKQRKQQLTPGFYPEALTLKDAFHPSLDLYGFGEMLSRYLLSAFPDYDFAYAGYLRKLRQVADGCRRRPSELALSIQQARQEFQQIRKHAKMNREGIGKGFEGI